MKRTTSATPAGIPRSRSRYTRRFRRAFRVAMLHRPFTWMNIVRDFGDIYTILGLPPPAPSPFSVLTDAQLLIAFRVLRNCSRR
jgi:hypothetical protein